MKEEFKNWMVDEIQHQFMPKGQPTIKLVCQWIKQSLSRVRYDLIVKSFKCDINKALDGTEDHHIYEDDNNDDEEEEKECSDDNFQEF